MVPAPASPGICMRHFPHSAPFPVQRLSDGVGMPSIPRSLVPLDRRPLPFPLGRTCAIQGAIPAPPVAIAADQEIPITSTALALVQIHHWAATAIRPSRGSRGSRAIHFLVGGFCLVPKSLRGLEALTPGPRSFTWPLPVSPLRRHVGRHQIPTPIPRARSDRSLMVWEGRFQGRERTS